MCVWCGSSEGLSPAKNFAAFPCASSQPKLPDHVQAAAPKGFKHVGQWLPNHEGPAGGENPSLRTRREPRGTHMPQWQRPPGHAESPAGAQWWTHSFGDAPKTATAQRFRATCFHTNTHSLARMIEATKPCQEQFMQQTHFNSVGRCVDLDSTDSKNNSPLEGDNPAAHQSHF